MSTDAETVVRAAYRAAEGSVLDVQGFIDLFTEDGVFNNVVAGESYRGEYLGDQVAFMGALAPDIHRELHRFHVTGNVAAVELTIQGTFTGPFETPAGTIRPTGAKLNIPTADFWYVENGRIKEFNCYVGLGPVRRILSGTRGPGTPICRVVVNRRRSASPQSSALQLHAPGPRSPGWKS